MNGKTLRISILLVFLIQLSQSYSQTSIRGKVTARSSIPAGVRIDLVPENTPAGTKYTFTDSKGIFAFSDLKPGHYGISFRSLAFKTVNKSINLTTDTLKLSIELEDNIIQLEEVYVTPKKFHQRVRDTIELDAKSYLQGEERTVEDLLRKIPGMQISENGTIKIGNKEIEKVMVEGDDLFGKGYKLLTQNLSAQPIEKVQVLQRYSNNKHLKGIEHSEKVALNLTLNQESKSQWVGGIDAAGSPFTFEQYNVQAHLMNFGKKATYYLLGSANNNGMETLRGIDHLILSQDPNEPGQIGLQVSTPSFMDNKPRLQEFDQQRSSFNNDKLLSLNGIFNLTKDMKVKWLGFANRKKNTFIRKSLSEYDIEDVRFSNTDDLRYTNSDIGYFSKIDLAYDLNKNATLTYIGTIGNTKDNDTGELTFNGIASLETTQKRSLLSNQLLNYTQKLSERAVLVSSFRWISQHSPINYSTNRYFYGDLFEQDGIETVGQKAENNVEYYGIISQFVKRDAKDNPLSTSISHEITRRNFNSSFYTMGDLGETHRPVDFSNILDIDERNTAISAQYTWKSPRLELTPSITARYLTSILNDRIAQNSTYLQNKLWSPKTTLLWIPHRNGELRSEVSYQRNMSDNALEILPNFVYMGNRTFSRGLKENPMLDAFNLNSVYTLGKMTDKLYTILSAGYSHQFHYIGQQQELTPDYSRIQHVLFKNRTATYFSTQINYFIAVLKGNLRLTTDGQIARYQIQIEGYSPNQIRTVQYQVGLEYRSVWEGPVNIFTKLQINNSSLQNGQTSKFRQARAQANIHARLNKNIRASLKNELYLFDKNLYNQPGYYLFSDFILQYYFRNKKLHLELMANNIFDVTTFTQISLRESYRSTASYTLRPRQVMLGINYSF
ncbi:TonB-dependent receptor [Sphingobacterium sp. SYP-B4668]|uniref:TonB-dependent receptor n=1 Tax=Sphingobacterium sp. SYP-B4668 TaxID=2996035 RepID=UPI0022DD5140|nr:TonB-dependent receptor [Sphingobacterium sp. SYP-B4668]